MQLLTYDSATFDTFTVRRSNFCFRNVISLLNCSARLLLNDAPAEPDPWLDAPWRYAFLISISVVLTAPIIGRCTSQNARSCESNTLRSNLSRFLSTLLCASAYSKIFMNMVRKYIRWTCCVNWHIYDQYIFLYITYLHKNKFPLSWKHFL